MQKFAIQYKEIFTSYFEVEAESPADALNRFETWRINEPVVHDIATNSDNFESEADIIGSLPGYIGDDACLTDDDYRYMMSNPW